MINASHDKEFVFHNGNRARNLLELVSRIESISDHEFHHFVNPHKNDFANWTEHVLGDKHFADKLRTLLSKNETISLIKDRIAEATFGNSIIKIPKVDHDAPHHEEHVNVESRSEHTLEHNPEHNHEHRLENHVTVPVEHLVEHTVIKHNNDPNKPIFKHYPNHNVVHHKKQVDDDNFISNDKDKRHEELKKSESRNNWFHLFSQKNLSRQTLNKVGREENDKLYSETELREEIEQDSRENALWVILYFALVLLIITLLVYKLFL